MMRRILAVFILALLALTASAETISAGIVEVIFENSDRAAAERSLEVIQEALKQYEEHLPAGNEPIRIVVCHTHPQFYKYSGTYAQGSIIGLAKPFEGLIAVKAPRILLPDTDYSGTLRHELVHVLLARNTNYGYLPKWLNEGIAMTVSEERRWSSVVQMARMFTRGRIIKYPELDFAFRAPNSESELGEAYAQAYSMTGYLIDRIGEDEFWDLVNSLNSMNFADALRKKTDLKPREFWEEWQKSLWKVAVFTSIVSGFSIFQVMALLTIWAYIRHRRRSRLVLDRWEEEEAEDGYVYEGMYDEDESIYYEDDDD